MSVVLVQCGLEIGIDLIQSSHGIVGQNTVLSYKACN